MAVPPRDEFSPVRGVGACTAALAAWADGLATCGMTTGALAATGGYGMPRWA